MHDFFTPQPVQKPSLFLLRMIMHDWSDEYSLKLLTQLRTVAGPDTQLLIVDNTIYYACEDTSIAHDIPGAAVSAPPAPLLTNNGVAGAQPYLADLHVSGSRYSPRARIAFDND